MYRYMDFNAIKNWRELDADSMERFSSATIEGMEPTLCGYGPGGAEIFEGLYLYVQTQGGQRYIIDLAARDELDPDKAKKPMILRYAAID